MAKQIRERRCVLCNRYICCVTCVASINAAAATATHYKAAATESLVVHAPAIQSVHDC